MNVAFGGVSKRLIGNIPIIYEHYVWLLSNCLLPQLLTTDERIERPIVTETYHKAIGVQSYHASPHYDALHQSREES